MNITVGMAGYAAGNQWRMGDFGRIGCVICVGKERVAEIVKRLGTSGREISLRGRIGATAAKPPAPPSRDRLRGVFWTNPESWRAPVKMA